MAPENREKEMGVLRSELMDFWDSELKGHFEAEEEMLKVFATHVGGTDKDIARTISDHHTLKQLLQKGFKEDLLRFAELLASHIRFEEETLFGRIEAALTAPEAQRQGEMLSQKAVPACIKIPAKPKDP